MRQRDEEVMEGAQTILCIDCTNYWQFGKGADSEYERLSGGVYRRLHYFALDKWDLTCTHTYVYM